MEMEDATALALALDPATEPQQLVRLFDEWSLRSEAIYQAVLVNPNLPERFLTSSERTVKDFRVLIQRPSWALDVLACPSLIQILREREQENVSTLIFLIPDSGPHRLHPLLADLVSTPTSSTPLLRLFFDVLEQTPRARENSLVLGRTLMDQAAALGLDERDEDDYNALGHLRVSSTFSLPTFLTVIADELQRQPRRMGEALNRHFLAEPIEVHGVRPWYEPLGSEEA